MLAVSIGWIFLNNSNAPAFILLYSLLLLLLFSIASLFFARFFIKVTQQCPKQELFKGEETFYSLQISNKSLWGYSRIEYYCDDTSKGAEYSSPPFDVTTLSPFGKIKKQFKIIFPYRGVYQIGLTSLRVTDFLGLFSISLPIPEPHFLEILPLGQYDFIFPLGEESSSNVMVPNLWNEDYSAAEEIRAYQNSDSLKRVHWKLSAKKGELLVKQYLPLSKPQTVLIIDNRALPKNGFSSIAWQDEIIEWVASSVMCSLQEQLPTTIVWGISDAEQTCAQFNSDSLELFRCLSSIPFHNNSTSLQTVHQLGDSGGAFSLVFFLFTLDNNSIEAIQSAISLGYYVQIVLIQLTSSEKNRNEAKQQLDAWNLMGISSLYRSKLPPRREVNFSE